MSMLELARRMDPDGDLSVIAEILAEDNEWLVDANWLEANDVFSHKHTQRTSLPSGSWRKINEGVGVESSQTIEVIENIGMLEVYSEVDKELVDAAPNPASFRMQESSAFLEGLAQTLAATFLYGDEGTDPEQFTGLAPRMASLAATANVIGEGGTGSDLTSIFIVQWGETRTHMIYPRGSQLGIRHTDMGEVTVTSATSLRPSTAQYQAYRDHFQTKSGLVVRNPKCIARLCNIETTGTTNTFDEDNLITLLNRMPMKGKGAAIYVNETVLTQMEIKLKDKNNVFYTASGGEGLAGEPMIRFRGNPIRLMDQILITEAALT
jgi:hypothetical protein